MREHGPAKTWSDRHESDAAPLTGGRRGAVFFFFFATFASFVRVVAGLASVSVTAVSVLAVLGMRIDGPLSARR